MSTTLTPARQGIPLRPDRDAAARDWVRSFTRASTARVMSVVRRTRAELILQESWPDDSRAEMILRSAVEPLKVGDYPGGTAAKIMLLASDSTLSEIMDIAVKVDLTGLSQFSFPLPTDFSEAVFVEEGMPIPAAKGAFEGLPIGPIKKVALIAPLTNELENLSAPVASVVISHLLRVSVSDGGAKVLLSANPATAAAPAGLLYNVAPLAAGGSISEDLSALIEAISAAGIDTRSVAFICAPKQALTLQMQPWPNFKHKIIEARTLASGTVIAIAADGFVVAGEGTPVVDASKQAVLHIANPAEMISTAGSPNAVAVPTVSTFQTDSFALRCIARMTWSAAPGAVAWIENVMW